MIHIERMTSEYKPFYIKLRETEFSNRWAYHKTQVVDHSARFDILQKMMFYVIKNNTVPVGYIFGEHGENDELDLTIELCAKHCGNGFTYSAIKEFMINHPSLLCAYILNHNIASIKLFRSIGFKKTNISRKHIDFKGNELILTKFVLGHVTNGELA